MDTASVTEVLRRPHPCDHVVQLYTDDAVLASAVSKFVAEGFSEGEAALIIATAAHRTLFADRLAASGIDVGRALERGQLVMLDAAECLGRFMIDGVPDRSRFFATLTTALEGVRASGFRTMRLYGEMVNLLWDENLDATVQLEELWNELLAIHGLPLLCAYRIDNFDPGAHRGLLHRISPSHSHLIPVDDCDRLDDAVSRAYADVFGADGDADVLRTVMASTLTPPTLMPPAQAALFALRGFPPGMVDAVLERARHYYLRSA
jgi:hypothetical protein